MNMVPALVRVSSAHRKALTALVEEFREELPAGVPRPADAASVEQWIEERTTEERQGIARTFAVLMQSGVVGIVRLRSQGGGLAQISYWTAPGWRNLGITTHACRILVKYAVQVCHFAEIIAHVHAGNGAS